MTIVDSFLKKSADQKAESFGSAIVYSILILSFVYEHLQSSARKMLAARHTAGKSSVE